MELTALIDIVRSTSTDLRECGSAASHLVQKALDSIEDEDYVNADRLAQNLLRLSNEKILSFNYKDVPTCWRRLYTDAVIIKVIAGLYSIIPANNQGKTEDKLRMIKELDMVLIVAGAPGERRTDIIFDLIHRIQQLITSIESNIQSDGPSPTKRVKLDPTVFPSSISSSRPILTHEYLPDFETSFSQLSTPFIVRQGASDWPALTNESTLWKSSEYLKRVAGPGRVVPVEVGGDYTKAGWSQEIMEFDRVLDAMEVEDHDSIYLAQYDLFASFPRLLNDIIVPDLVFASPAAPSFEASGVDYKPPANKDGYITNAWLGPGGTVSPPHTDPYYNCYTQVVGSKWIWIAPPQSILSMYPFGESSEIENGIEGEEDTTSSSYMTNTSRVDVAGSNSLADLSSRFPKFVENVLPLAQSAILQAGDVLVMPPGWWHSMRSLDKSISVSVWF